MLKAVKKLKLWSRKRKKKKANHLPHYTHPPPTYHCCCSCSSTQPSAPPLPSWLASEQTHEPIFATGVQPGGSGLAGDQAQFSQQDVVMESSSLIYSTTPADTTSYQQYMIPNPVYGVPVVVPAVRRERSAGFFGCVVGIGIHLIRCFCPCFRIREVY